MINKIKLYFDTIKRISLKQNIFLIKEKVFKKFFPVKLSTLDIIEKNFDLNKLLKAFQKNLTDLKLKNNQEVLWNLGVLENNFQHHYQSYIYDNLKKYKISKNSDELKILWETTHNDIEFIYNIQRMYKFNEIMILLDFNDGEKLSVINSWIDKHPPQKGASWMGFNCSIRLINWVKILASLKTLDSIKKNDVTIILLSMLQNIEFIEKNIEHHIPGNHIIFQYFALWLITFLFDDKRKNKYANLFEDEFDNEFYESGLHFELSTHYHVQVLQLGVYYSLIKYKQKKIPKVLFNKIKKAFHVLDSFSFSKNNLPLIGDNCYNFFHNNIVEDTENLNFLRKFLSIDEKEKIDITEIKNEYLIAVKNKFKIIFDVGNIGLVQNPGHGHSDILSINLSYNGIPIFVDPGVRRYSKMQEDLQLKKARSHNTLFINTEDQAKLWGFFRWAYLPTKIIYNYRLNENSIILEGNFEGFKNIGGGIHARKIELNDSEVLICDKVNCAVLNRVEQNFILSEFINFEENNGKYYLKVSSYKFEFIVDTKESYYLQVIPQKIYKSYDNPVDSTKIKIIYNTSLTKFETKVKLALTVNEN